MNISTGLGKTAYTNIICHLYTASETVFKKFCKKAAQEEKEENSKQDRPLLNLKVSGDGSWKKRGFSSKYGVINSIGYYTGKLVDLVVKSSEFKSFTAWMSKKGTPEYE